MRPVDREFLVSKLTDKWLPVLESHLTRHKRGFLVCDENNIIVFVSEYGKELLEFDERQTGIISLFDLFPGIKATLPEIEQESALEITQRINTSSGRQKELSLTWESEYPSLHGVGGTIVWIAENNESPAIKNKSGLAPKGWIPNSVLQLGWVLDRLNLGYLVVDSDGYIEGYNDHFKTMLNLSGDWIGRNIFSFPPLHQFGIAPYLLKNLHNGQFIQNSVFKYRYSGIARTVLLGWYGVPLHDQQGLRTGAFFCTKIEKDLHTLNRVITLHKNFIENIVAFIRGFEAHFNREQFFNYIIEYWGSTIYKSKNWAIFQLTNKDKSLTCFRDTLGLHVQQFDKKHPLSLFVLSANNSFAAIPAEVKDEIFRHQTSENAVLFSLEDNDAGKFIFFFTIEKIPDENLINKESFEYLTEILEKLYQKVMLNEKMQQEFDQLAKKSQALEQKNKEKNELFAVVKDANDNLYDKLHRYERRVKELEHQLELKIETEKRQHLNSFLRGLISEVNQQMTGIRKAYTELGEKGELTEEINNAMQQPLEKINQLFYQLKMFSEETPAQVQYVDLNKILEKVVLKLHRKYSILRRLHFSKGSLPELLISPQKMETVFADILKSMITDSEDLPGSFYIKTEFFGKTAIVDIGHSKLYYPVQDGDLVFRPFFKINNNREDCGLSYFTSRQILLQAKGDIEFQTDQETGTRFRIKLPVA